jgi:hypothetical protein
MLTSVLAPQPQEMKYRVVALIARPLYTPPMKCSIQTVLIFSLLFCLGGAACSDSPSAGRDQGIDRPANLQDLVGRDLARAEATLDHSPELKPLDALTDSAGCSGSCAQQSLVATFGAAVEPFERSVYGLDQDAKGKAGIYLEAMHGGFSGCPEQSSPTPDRTLILSGLPLPTVGATVSKSDGLVVTLLDYKGTLLQGEPLSKATASKVTFTAAEVCVSCVGQTPPSHPAGFVALELEATFDEGTVKGHLYARHCDSLEF